MAIKTCCFVCHEGVGWGILNRTFNNNTIPIRSLFLILPLGSGGIPYTFNLSKGPGSCGKNLLFFSLSPNGRMADSLTSFTATPNPVSGLLTVNITEPLTNKSNLQNGEYLVNICELNTLLPLKQLRIKKSGSSFQINMAGFKTGYYAVEINDGVNKQVLKVYKL
jgi:Secretion system C-terminal sorting domain